MVRKCDTQKYRRRRVREIAAHARNVARRQIEERQRLLRLRAAEEQRRQEWLADPRRQKIQELVNILAARLYADPVYRIMVIERTMRRMTRW